MTSFRTLLLSFVAVCLFAVSSVAAPVVLFDQSHGQAFHIEGAEPLGLSLLARLYQENGYLVSSRTEPLTPEALASVDVLFMSGPFRALSESELATVTDFLRDGGGLAVMLHIAHPMRDLLHRLEVDFTNGTLREANHVVGSNPLNFRVRLLADHPVTNGLDSFSVYGCWALRGTTSQSRSIAETSRQSYVDLNHDNRKSGDDAVQQFAVMVAGELGAGRYVVIGDDAVFQNQFLDDANRRLGLQMLQWLSH